MMPRGPQKLALSKMHMLGMGKVIIRDIMKKQSVTPLEGLISSFQQKGGKLIGYDHGDDGHQEGGAY